MHEIDWKWCPRVAAHELTSNFLLSQARLQKARQTLEAYGRDLDDLLEAFADLAFNDLIEADSGQLELYIDGLYNRPPKHGASAQPQITRITNTRLSLATIRRRVGTARRFYQWLIDRRLRADLINPVPRGAKGISRGPVPASRQEPWIPDDAVWERILRHFLEHESLRNQVLLFVCYDGALRRQECLHLRIEDIDDASLTIKVRADITKNRKERLVVLSPITYQKLHLYITRERARLIEDYGGDAGGFIFLSESHRNPGQPLSVWTFQDVMKKVRKLVGTPALTPHKLRHLMLNDLARGGMEIHEVSYYAGHASLESTNLYLHPQRETVARHVRKATKWRDERIRLLIEEIQPNE
jgi:site-specific recombinase XerD